MSRARSVSAGVRVPRGKVLHIVEQKTSFVDGFLGRLYKIAARRILRHFAGVTEEDPGIPLIHLLDEELRREKRFGRAFEPVDLPDPPNQSFFGQTEVRHSDGDRGLHAAHPPTP